MAAEDKKHNQDPGRTDNLQNQTPGCSRGFWGVDEVSCLSAELHGLVQHRMAGSDRPSPTLAGSFWFPNPTPTPSASVLTLLLWVQMSVSNPISSGLERKGLVVQRADGMLGVGKGGGEEIDLPSRSLTQLMRMGGGEFLC